MTHALRWAAGLALVLGLVVLGAGGGLAADENVQKGILKVADAVAKGSGAKEEAAKAAKAHTELDAIMELFKLRTKGGLGVGKTAGAIKPDGIESKLQGLDKRAPTEKEAKADAEGLVQIGYISAAIAMVIENQVPSDKKKDAPKWKALSQEMEKTGVAFSEAVKKGAPADIQKAAKALNNACIKCHDDFR